MLVSGFNLEYAPGSSSTPAYTSGYELEISNLSNTDIQFDVYARVTRYSFRPIAPPDPPATVLGNLKELIRGVLRNDLWTWFDGGWFHDSNGFALVISMPIAAGTSELFDITPSLYQSRTWYPRIAGHIDLTIPAVRSLEPPYDWGPQADGPVPVLLNASTVERWQVPVTGGGGAFADSRTSPPLTGGKSQIEINPAAFPEPYYFSVREYLDGLKDLGREGLARGAVALTPAERAQTLIDLLAAVDDDAERQAINDVLEGLGAATRIVGGE